MKDLKKERNKGNQKINNDKFDNEKKFNKV